MCAVMIGCLRAINFPLSVPAANVGLRSGTKTALHRIRYQLSSSSLHRHAPRPSPTPFPQSFPLPACQRGRDPVHHAVQLAECINAGAHRSDGHHPDRTLLTIQSGPANRSRALPPPTIPAGQLQNSSQQIAIPSRRRLSADASRAYKVAVRAKNRK